MPPIRTVPRMTPVSASIWPCISTTSASTRLAWSRMTLPSSVSSTERLERRKIWMPIHASSRLSGCEITDCARNSSSAALVKDRWRATATIVRKCRSSMDPWCGPDHEKSKSDSGRDPSRGVMDGQQRRDRLRVPGVFERGDLDPYEPAVGGELGEHLAHVLELQPARHRELHGHHVRVEPIDVEVHVHGPVLR